MLEQQLASQSEIEVADVTYSHSHGLSTGTEAASATTMEEMEWTMPFDLAQSSWTEHLEIISEPNLDSNWQDYSEVSQGIEAATRQRAQTPDDPSITSDLPSLIQFDLVHPLFPMVHKRRYMSWTKSKDPSPARQCLRMTMRALAASMSSQFRSRGEDLCLKARQMAEDLEASELGLPWTDTIISIEQIQAWLLLVHYQLLAPHIYPVSTTARQALRLVYLSRLHCSDQQEPSTGSSNSSNDSTSTGPNFPTIEERRRTFWVAFCLDRFLSACEESLPAIHDEIVDLNIFIPHFPCQILTLADLDEVKMGFADEALKYAKLDATLRFAEFVTSMALFGRCTIQKHIPKSGPSLEKESSSFWKRHEWLASATKRQIDLLSTNATDLDDEPMAIVTLMVTYGSIIALAKASKAMPCQTEEEQLVSEAYDKSAGKAAAKMADLSSLITSSTCFKGSFVVRPNKICQFSVE
ncbi:acetate regulatory DNA binding protein FacB [Fusarium bulbicola]|nr:acetate regulatory DNA binding protein FacB [Fusarium bulbicola]